EMRYDMDGNENPDFVLNSGVFREAEIIVAGDNFGCGSSREHAPWALKDFGIKAVISTSFADIFFNNCFKNGILPIVLPEEAVALLMKDAEKGANARMTVDLEEQTVTSSDGASFSFEVDSFKKHCLLEGLDDIGLSMEKASSIDAFEAQAEQSRPWV
ncbi:MAG: 3-isopropylmalate dehydratase small subunit, partial [Rhodobacteraceae bacterium]|nr:3-isopropylmalate dehydratase small subunit [Paracoccaceae bacterium]